MEPLAAIPWLDTYTTISDEHLLTLTDLLHDDNATASSPLFHPSQDIDDNRATKLSVPGGAAYFGPTIEDIENALSITPRSKDLQSHTHIPHTGFSILERGSMNKVEHKYSLRIKSCGGNMVADDGYKWRKYGQKSIKNSPNPSAKKQVERSMEDPDTYIITYEGLHLHFAYPFFLMGQSSQAQSPTKKPKTVDPQPEAHKSPTFLAPDDPKESTGPQGLLEDMVPWMIRNPSTNRNGLSNSSSCVSHRSPPTSPPSPSTCPTFVASCF
ncbi:probable WRKY transcription factor 49 isoform X2 [Benincasa hispida]|uniref:probable WRKY transcription factor 49 isoform X2 n=1 Tax=Benincasa hispida TaxID=102211 RepID=UPI001901BD7A|nr:probable WRKY transcription factor 49 isoform X2 [Benincasa hispida]